MELTVAPGNKGMGWLTGSNPRRILLALWLSFSQAVARICSACTEVKCAGVRDCKKENVQVILKVLDVQRTVNSSILNKRRRKHFIFYYFKKIRQSVIRLIAGHKEIGRHNDPTRSMSESQPNIVEGGIKR